MADIHETDLLGKVFFETSPNTGTATWTDHTATVSRMSLSRGGALPAVGISDAQVGTGTISLVDNTATIGIGYWVRVRTLSGNVWAGFVQDISTSFEWVNGTKYVIKSLFCVDWVGYAGQFLFENLSGLESNGAISTTMPYTSAKRVYAMNYGIDPTGGAVLISQDGDSTLTVSNTNVTASLTEHLDLLANSVGGYWNATTATPTNGTTGRDGLILFSRRTNPASTGLVFADVDNASAGRLSYQGLTVGQSSSSLSNSVILRNTAQLALELNNAVYDASLMFSHEYGAEMATSISTYGKRQMTVETNLGLGLASYSNPQNRNRCKNPNFEYGIDGWVGSANCSISQRDPSTEATPWSAYVGTKVLRGRVTTSTTAISMEYAPNNGKGVPVSAGGRYSISAWAARLVGPINSRAQIRVDWLSDDETVLSTSSGSTFTLTTGRTWYQVTASFFAPANAVSATFRVYFDRPSSGTFAANDKFCIDYASFAQSASVAVYESSGEYSANNSTISFSLGEIGNSESVTVTNQLYTRALAIADANDVAYPFPETLTWNAQNDLTKVHLIDLNKTVTILYDINNWLQKVVGIRHEITRDKWIVDLELEAKDATPLPG